MEQIYDTNDQFNFEKLQLSKPTAVLGGNYFIRFTIDGSYLYIQPPKCKTKQGVIKAGKKYYSDLMFTNENDQFIRWMENLESHCHASIYKNRSQWFESEMEMHDIENYFTSPMKVFKSGTFYIVRSNISTVLGKPTLKIYDENENEVDMDSITENMNVMTILEIQGIKCSAKSFQIEIEIKQMMTTRPVNLFEKCIIKTKAPDAVAATPPVVEPSLAPRKLDEIEDAPSLVAEKHEVSEEVAGLEEVAKVDAPVSVQVEEETTPDLEVASTLATSSKPDTITEPREIEEIEFHLEGLPVEDTVQIKKRNDVYYEMYREARRKAKIARDLALSSYLEAKRIKNTYMLDDIRDSDDSDLEQDVSEN
jgi:hypothetical protein